MFPPSGNFNINLQALSGVTGSISIACWIVVFSPQILQNFRRGSADGLSLTFLIVWLLGDVFNVVGAVMQGVLPTMIILAAYYTLADIILLLQCLYYRRKSRTHPRKPSISHLSPATPLLDPPAAPAPTAPSPLTAAALNLTAITTVIAAGVAGWYLSTLSPTPAPTEPAPAPQFNFWGQVFGYACAALYLFSRVPQILLNHRRKSCEGVSILFFMFAGIGNLTYVLSILAYAPDGEWDAGRYARYLAVNASWLVGSVGTLLLDAVIFAQFFWYDGRDALVEGDEEVAEDSASEETVREEVRGYGTVQG